MQVEIEFRILAFEDALLKLASHSFKEGAFFPLCLVLHFLRLISEE